ncbi:hypothetical protein KA005_09925 [bacterium]|nr:hypothetical protein [bacterium]
MGKKKSVFEKLGLIDVEEIEEEVAEESILSPKKEYIKDEEVSEDTFHITEDQLSGMNMYNKEDELDILFEEEELFEEIVADQEPDVQEPAQELLNRVDIEPTEERQVQVEAHSVEKERTEQEIREYERMAGEMEGIQSAEEINVEPEFLGVDEIYGRLQLDHDKRKSIFMVNEFLSALPDSLPTDVKRKSVKDIITASGVDINNLMDDAFRRLDALNTVLESQLNKTEEIIANNNRAIAELENQIMEIRKEITKRKKMQEDQKSAIEYENQRINYIVQFINPEE